VERPEDFAVTGRKIYRGIPCFVVQRRKRRISGFDRWYVGEKTGFLHGREVRSFAWVPKWELWLLDYIEIKPGRWFPRTQGWTTFMRKPFRRVIDSQIELTGIPQEAEPEHEPSFLRGI